MTHTLIHSCAWVSETIEKKQQQLKFTAKIVYICVSFFSFHPTLQHCAT